jgi:hypothetical protein
MDRMTLLAVSLFSLAQASVAAGQTVDSTTRGAARDLALRGKVLAGEGKHAEALDAFNRADEVMHLPSLGLEAARCLVKLDRWVDASERLRAVARTEYQQAGLNEIQRSVQEQARQDAERERTELAPKIPSLILVLTGNATGVTLYLDNRRLPTALAGAAIPVDPGPHVVRIERGDWESHAATTVKPGEKTQLGFVLPAPPPLIVAPPPAPATAPQPAEPARSAVPVAPHETDWAVGLRPPAPPTREEGLAQEPQGATDAILPHEPHSSALRTVGWTIAGVGLAGLGVGIVTGLLALSQKSDLQKKCPGDQCGPENWGAVDSYNHLKLTSTIGLAAGGACLVTGVILVLASPSGEQPAGPKVAFGVGPRSAQVRIRF